jgi:hypothetical protein
MTQYETTIEFEGKIDSTVAEHPGNEDAKRAAKERMRVIGVPLGKYAFVKIIKQDDKKVILDDLWAIY